MNSITGSVGGILITAQRCVCGVDDLQMDGGAIEVSSGIWCIEFSGNSRRMRCSSVCGVSISLAGGKCSFILIMIITMGL